jgi:hypothetical protein
VFQPALSRLFLTPKGVSSFRSKLVDDEEWDIFRDGSTKEVGALLINLALKIDLWRFKKNKRGPKKPPKPKEKFVGKHHVSTA